MILVNIKFIGILVKYIRSNTNIMIYSEGLRSALYIRVASKDKLYQFQLDPQRCVKFLLWNR